VSRQVQLCRRTAETEIELALNLDGQGRGDIATGIGFFDHMLILLAKHALFDLTVKAQGDLAVDGHHLVEDVGIVLGRALRQALGDGCGLTRYGWALVPMDEALAQTAIDLGGRVYLSYEVELGGGRSGDFEPELCEEFLRALVNNAQINLHLHLLSGGNTHHALEACFKSIARALRIAVAPEPREVGIPSTKGVID